MKIRTVSDKDIDAVKSNENKLSILQNGEFYEDDFEDLEAEELEELSNWKPEAGGQTFQVEGTFPAIHYLLTGESEWKSGTFPLNFLTGQTLEVGEIGWGPARFYYSKEVVEINKALTALDKSELLQRFNPQDFDDKNLLRGYKWQATDGEELVEKVQKMSDFLEQAVVAKMGIYLTIE